MNSAVVWLDFSLNNDAPESLDMYLCIGSKMYPLKSVLVSFY